MLCLRPLRRLQFCLACMRQKAGREPSSGVPMATQEAANLLSLHEAEGWEERSAGVLLATQEAEILLSLHAAEGWERKIRWCAYGHSGGCSSA